MSPSSSGRRREGYRSTEVLREPLYVYAPPDTEEAPEQGEWALYPQGRRTRLLIDEGLALRGLRPRVTLESDNPAVLRQMVALGLCWSVLPAEIAEAGTPSLRPQRRELVAERTLLRGPPRARAGRRPRRRLPAPRHRARRLTGGVGLERRRQSRRSATIAGFSLRPAGTTIVSPATAGEPLIPPSSCNDQSCRPVERSSAIT